MRKAKRVRIDPKNLELVECVTYEEIILGDFVRMASGSPIGIVIHRDKENAKVFFLEPDCEKYMTLPWVCWRRIPQTG